VLTNCTIRGNTSTFPAFAGGSGGGAIYSGATYDGKASANLTGCTLSGNTTDYGGGIYNGARYSSASAALTLTNCTLSGNAAAYSGGGISSQAQETGSASASVINCTFSGNSATAAGGALDNEVGDSTGAASLKLLNTILRAGASGGTIASPGNAVFSSLGHNLSSDAAGGDATTGPGGYLSSAGDIRNTDPLLNLLQDNGGPTPTMALLSGSPAINAGDDAVLSTPYNLTTDQRLLPRKQGAHVDIGACEFDSPQSSSTLVVNTTDEHSDGVCGLADCTLWDAANAANANAGSTITFKSGLSGTITTKIQASGIHLTAAVTIKGPGARVLAISGGDQGRVFNITGGPVVISGLTIRNGRTNGTPGDNDNGTDGGDASGGGIFNSSTLTLIDCAIRACVASGGGGGLIGGNGGTARGGGLYSTGTLTLNGCTLSGNAAQGGPGAYGVGGQAGGNGGIGAGGGVFSIGTLTLTNCTFSDNTAAGGDGGTGFTDENGFASDGGNGGAGQGGGLFSALGLTMTHCTLNGNFANGGAPGGSDSSSSGGTAGVGSGGGLYRYTLYGGTATVNSTIIDGNTANSHGFDVAGTGGIEAGDYNLTQSADVFLPGAHNPPPQDPGLDSAGLKNNGGLIDTIALLSGSPAINKGDPANTPATDQRDYTRNGISDIGAFEYNGVPPRAFRVDALIKKNSDASTAFALNNVYQLTPAGAQIENQSVSTGVIAKYQVKVQNDTAVSRTFGVKVSESTGAGWTLVYKSGTTNISTAIKSTAGYKTGVLAPGASEIITVQMTPNAGASTTKSSALHVFLGGTDKVTRDVVKAMTGLMPSSAPSGASL
jgi:hypothetical protein